MHIWIRENATIDELFSVATRVWPGNRQIEARPFPIVCIREDIIDIFEPEGTEQQPLRAQLDRFDHRTTQGAG